MADKIAIGSVVGLPQSRYMGWPLMAVEDLYDKQISNHTTRPMALVAWLNKEHGFVRAEVPVDLLVVRSLEE